MIISLQNIRASFVVINDIAFQCTASQKESSSIYNHVVYFVLFLFFNFCWLLDARKRKNAGWIYPSSRPTYQRTPHDSWGACTLRDDQRITLKRHWNKVSANLFIVHCLLVKCVFLDFAIGFTTVLACCLGSFQEQIEESFKFCINKSSVSPQLLIFNGFADSHDIMT